MKLHIDPNCNSFVHEAMATVWTLYLVGEDSQYLRQGADEAFKELDFLESKLSLYQESSDVSRVNALKAGESTRVSYELISCLDQALMASRLLNGKFNPLMGLPSITVKKQAAEFLEFPKSTTREIGDNILSIDKETFRVTRLEDGPWLDLGGIGKGYALDFLKAFLVDWDITDGLLVSGGSTILAMGSPSIENDFWSGEFETNGGVRQFKLTDGQGLASSGLSFQNEHIIDPDTGYSETTWRRSYAVCEGAALADAASTASMLLYMHDLEKIAAKEASLAFCLVSDDPAIDEPVEVGGFFK